jgi:serine/threonine protein phosphatase PrpC
MNVASKVIPYYDDKGFDAIVCNEQNGLFGIFDGMGTRPDARIASGMAREYFEDVEQQMLHFEILRYMLLDLKEKIGEKHLSTGTTATVVHVDRVGHLHYAHGGDSRLYVLDGQRVKQVTADEGVSNILYNYLGDHGIGICQLGFIDHTRWNKFMLCSDGVTGDTDEQEVSDKDIEMILLTSVRPETAANKILNLSSKPDDKSIIVVSK